MKPAANGPRAPNSPFSQFSRLVGALPAPALFILTVVLDTQQSPATFESPFLLAILNTIFLCAIPLALSYEAAKSHRATKFLGFLLVGCGLALFGLGSLYAGWVMPLAGNPNPTVTLHNLGSLTAGICQFAGAHIFLTGLSGNSEVRFHPKSSWLIYSGIFILVSVTAFLAFYGYLPVFYDPQDGPSLLRQLVLGASICLFAMSGLLFLEIYAATRTNFAYWYGLALWLIAIGLIGVMLQHGVGSMLGWAGRAAQYVGCVYLLFAFLQGRREFAGTNGSGSDEAGWALWPYLEQKIVERTLALTEINEALEAEITKQKKTEELLRRSQQQIQEIIDGTPSLVYALDTDGRFLFSNSRFTSLFGSERDDLIGKDRSCLGMPEHIAEEHRTNDLEVIRTHRPAMFEETNVEADGVHVYSSQKFPLLDPNGKAYGVCGISTDITERKRIEDTLRKSEALFHNYFELGQVGMAITSPETGWLNVNSRLCELLGYTKEELTQMTWKELTHPDDLDTDLVQFRALLSGEIDRYVMDKRFIRKDGGIVYSHLTVACQRKPDNTVDYAIASLEDITWRKQLEAMLITRQSELENLYQRLQTLREDERTRIARELHDGTGHLLTALLMDLGWLDEKVPKDGLAISSKLVSAVELGEQVVDAIRGVMEDLRPPILDELGLVAAIEGYAAHFTTRTGIRCNLTTHGDPIDLRGALATDMYRIVQEALTNVMKHANATQASVSLSRTQESIRLEIVDDGSGMASDAPNGRGQFGLREMRERVSLRGGTLTVTSEPGCGLRLVALIPTGSGLAAKSPA